MASTYSPLKVELIGTGEQVAVWGQTTNTNLGTTIEQAIGGKADVTISSTSVTLTLTNTNALQDARALYLNLTGTPGGAATLNVPAVQKAYIVRNGTAGGNAVTVKVSGQTGVSVPNGATMHLYNNGTDVVNAVTNLPAGSTIGGSAISTATGTVTSVAAGNGMSFSTITSTGSVTLGTPDTLSTTSTNAVAGSTHTHAITTASASTPSTIVARDGTGSFSASTISMTTGNITTGNITTGNITTGNITTGNITTGNITTGNINTLTVGTQTNKATISYTTNTARTITIPNVGGNRTFSFLEEAQTFTANQTIAGNLIFSGNGRRIIGNFSSLDPNVPDRTIIQTSVTNDQTVINTIPNGTGDQSGFSALNSSDIPNASSIQILSRLSEGRLAADKTSATAVYNPLTFYTSGSERMRITTDGEVMIAGTTDQGAYNLQVNGTGVWGAGAYVNGSDARLKEDIKDLDSGLSVIEKLHPVSFKYRQDTDYTKDTRTHIGFIAQELQAALADKDYVDGVVETGGTYLGVAYQSLIPVLTKAIQELKTELDAVKAELVAMKGN
jgi:hypothetical protein